MYEVGISFKHSMSRAQNQLLGGHEMKSGCNQKLNTKQEVLLSNTPPLNIWSRLKRCRIQSLLICEVYDKIFPLTNPCTYRAQRSSSLPFQCWEVHILTLCQTHPPSPSRTPEHSEPSAAWCAEVWSSVSAHITCLCPWTDRSLGMLSLPHTDWGQTTVPTALFGILMHTHICTDEDTWVCRLHVYNFSPFTALRLTSPGNIQCQPSVAIGPVINPSPNHTEPSASERSRGNMTLCSPLPQMLLSCRSPDSFSPLCKAFTFAQQQSLAPVAALLFHSQIRPCGSIPRLKVLGSHSNSIALVQAPVLVTYGQNTVSAPLPWGQNAERDISRFQKNKGHHSLTTKPLHKTPLYVL